MPELAFNIPFGSEWTGSVSVPYTLSYDPVTNRTTVSFPQSSVSYPGRKGYGTESSHAITVAAGDNPSSTGAAGFTTDGTSNPAGVSYTGTPAPSVTVQHSAGPGEKTVAVSCASSIKVYPFPGSAAPYTITGGGSRTDTSHTVPCASAIASVSSAVETLGSFALSLTRYGASYRHLATITAGGATLYTSPSAFETGMSLSVPRSWLDAFPNAGELAATVSVQTYTDAGCATPVGSPATAEFTIRPDAGMAPALAAGFAEAAYDNAGTAAAPIAACVQSCSRAKITLDPGKVTLSNNAAVASYTVECQDERQTGTGTSYVTGTLTSAAATPITVTVTDSRGLTAGVTLTVTPLPYAPPVLSGVRVFRCDENGLPAEDGTYYSAQVTGGVSPLDGQNSLTALTAQLRPAGGSYGAADNLTNGVASVLGGTLDAEQSYTVLLTATDALGGTSTVTETIPPVTWAMKLRKLSGGLCVGFGKLPEHAKALELPADWQLYHGSTPLLPLPVSEGGTGAADAAAARTNLGVQREVLTVYDGADRYVIVLRYGNIIHLHVTLKVAVPNGTVTDNVSFLGVNPSANVAGYGWFQQASGYAPVSCVVTTGGDLQFLALVLNEPLAGTFDVWWTV